MSLQSKPPSYPNRKSTPWGQNDAKTAVVHPNAPMPEFRLTPSIADLDDVQADLNAIDAEIMRLITLRNVKKNYLQHLLELGKPVIATHFPNRNRPKQSIS